MNSSDSAEEFVKICLDGIDHAIRIMGVGAKNIGAMLIALSKEKKQTKGKTRLTNMLKTGKPLQIFTIKAEDLKKFSQEAKKYGILYCALANKKNSKIDGMVDILVRDEDSPKINRIADRFNFRSVASVKKDLENEKQNNLKVEIKTEEEKFIDDVMPKDMEKLINSPSRDTKDTEEKSLLEPSLNTKLKDKAKNSDVDKKSVREELKNIENELKERELQKENQRFEFNLLRNKNKNKKHKLTKDNNEVKKGKHFKPNSHLDNSKRKRKKRRKERSL